MLFAPTKIVFAYYSSLALLTNRHSMLFYTPDVERCVYTLISFFLSDLHGGPVDAAHDFEGASALVKLGVLLCLPSGVQAFISDVESGFSSSFKIVRSTTGRHI